VLREQIGQPLPPAIRLIIVKQLPACRLFMECRLSGGNNLGARRLQCENRQLQPGIAACQQSAQQIARLIGTCLLERIVPGDPLALFQRVMHRSEHGHHGESDHQQAPETGSARFARCGHGRHSDGKAAGATRAIECIDFECRLAALLSPAS
jgi:hypothetical protein